MKNIEKRQVLILKISNVDQTLHGKHLFFRFVRLFYPSPHYSHFATATVGQSKPLFLLCNWDHILYTLCDLYHRVRSIPLVRLERVSFKLMFFE